MKWKVRFMGDFFDKNIQRIIQESVPGKQITIAHVIASPMTDIYERLGIDEKGAIGILTLSPFETAIIAADIATKASDVEIGFLDRFTGSVVISGDVQSVETALIAVNNTLKDMLGFTQAPITRT
ncbi:microcompartments protein [Clostridium botulinum BKT015925]|nr:microcompartments protein [Clostridium botulinum BKT015925]